MEEEKTNVASETTETNQETTSNPEGSVATTENNSEVKPKQSKEVNAEFARQRREKEQQKAIFDAEMKATFSALKGKNPYTNEEMKDKTDYEEYLRMAEMEKDGLDPLTDYAKYQKQKMRKAQEEAEHKEQLQQQLKDDISAFEEAHPEEKLEDLSKNKVFLMCYRESGNLNEAYKNMKEIEKDYLDKANQEAARALALANANVGSLNGSSGATDNSYYSKEQVEAMSKEEIAKNLDKILASQKKWK